MRDAKRPPAFAENVVAHLADGTVVVQDFRGFHQHIQIEGLGIEFDRLFQIRDGDPDVREGECNHGKLPYLSLFQRMLRMMLPSIR